MAIRAVVDSAAALVQHRQYDSFGNADVTPIADFLFAFTGRPLDPDTGLYDYRARWYDPAIGRFLTEDPAGLAADPNLYRYCGNSPLVNVDPSGLCFTGLSSAFTSATSALGGALRDDSETSWGLSRFSCNENGTVPLPNAEVISDPFLRVACHETQQPSCPDLHLPRLHVGDRIRQPVFSCPLMPVNRSWPAEDGVREWEPGSRASVPPSPGRTGSGWPWLGARPACERRVDRPASFPSPGSGGRPGAT